MFAYERSLRHIGISVINCSYLDYPGEKMIKKESSGKSRTILLIDGLILFMRAAALRFRRMACRYLINNSLG